MSRYSIFSLLRNGLSYHQNWQRQWKSPAPRAVTSSSAAAAGLATAYYLAKEHGITNVAVLEKGWIGGGNTARNTTIVRSNYLWDESAALYEKAMKLWEGLSQDLNYNVMFSQRGVMNLAHTLQDVRDPAARERQPAQRHRRRVPHARPGPGNRTRHQPGQPLPGAGRVDPAARGRGPA